MKETMSSNGASPSVSMTRLDEPPPPHPNRLVPQSSSQPQAPPSKTHSRASSFSSTASTKSCSDGTLNNVHLTRISETSHLKGLPQDFLSLDPERPLLHIDEKGNEYKYFLQPMKMSVIFILFVEMLERFSFYGINYTTTAYLTGAYNEVWNADMSSIVASSYVSISTAVAYTTPFLGALLADNLLGEYMTILLGTLFCYIPGLLLIALTTIPQLLGEEFNHSAIRWGLLGLWPVGTGAVKACVNVFGAKQFHPILQSSLIETYYVNFYMCINIGALTGGILVPIVAQWNVTVAYFIPVCILGLGVLSFALGTTKYVKPKPKHEMNLFSRNALARISGACGCNNWRRDQRARNAASILIQPKQSKSKIGIGTISLVSALVVPFNVAYAQMSTTFIVQGSVMKNYGLVDASMMNNADAISVLAFGYAIGNIFYPELSKRDIKIPTTYKFAIGSAFGAAAVGCAIATEYQIHRVYDQTGEAISVLWQAFPYFLIGIGEIFAVSAAYEFAFAVSPVSMKSLASAANLFMVGGVPNVFCIMLYNACGSWFINSRGTANIHKLTDYSSAKVVNYFWLLEAVALFGVFVNVLPPIKEWVERIEEAALEDIKSPMSTPVIRKNLLKRKQQRMDSSGNDEETPLVRAQKHANYLKYGSGPELVKMGSMRAGPSLKKNRPTNPQRPLRVQSPAAQGSNTTYVKVGSILVPRPNEAPN